MSLNRSEQMVDDYVARNPEEQRFWQEKVRRIAVAAGDDHLAAAALADDLWAYYEERCRVVPAFLELAGREGLRRTSMRNLAEYWLRGWVEPRPKPRRADGSRS